MATQLQLNMALSVYSGSSVPLVPTCENDMEAACGLVNLGIARIERYEEYVNPYLELVSSEKCLRFINTNS